MNLLFVYLISFLPFLNEQPLTRSQTLEMNVMEVTNTDVEVEQLLQEWVLVGGWLNRDSIVFEKMDTSVFNQGLYKVLTFKKDQNIGYRTYNPQKYRMCGVGMVGMSSFTWKMDGKEHIVLHAIGHKLGESRFEYETRYSIEQVSEKSLKLVVDQRIKNIENNRY